MNIIIVDDEFINRKFLETVLAKYGNCYMAENGIEALELYNNLIKTEEKISVIFLDLMMPKMSGYEVLEKIREIEIEKKYEKTSIIVQTAAGEVENIEEAFKKGANSYLVKPIKKDAVVFELEEMGIKL